MKSQKEHVDARKEHLTLGQLRDLEDKDVFGICEICFQTKTPSGKENTTIKLSWVHLWFYGERKRVQRYLCKTCRDLEAKGQL